MSENAGIIARVSTTGQLDNTSADEQLRRCREYCAARGYSIVAEKTEAISGALVMARAGFRELCELADANQLSVIVADIPDRLGRGDAIAKLEFMAQLYGARIEYAQPGRDTSTIEGLIQYSAEQMVSGIERLNIKRRTTQGRRALATQGQVIASGLRIFGYDYASKYDERGRKVSCKLSARANEAAIVLQMFEWSAYEGLSSHAIARRLYNMGIPTVTDVDRTHTGRKRKGFAEWAPGTVRGILANETYAGQWFYSKNHVTSQDTPDGIKHTIHERERAEWIAVEVEPIVTVELFELTQHRLEMNSKKRPRPLQYQYLLRGHIRCARCGASMSGQTSRRVRSDGSIYQYQYYRCHKNWPDYGSNRCHAPNANGKVIDQAVWTWVKDQLLDDDTFLKSLTADRAEARRAHQIITDTLAALGAQDQKAQAKLGRFLDLYGSGDMDKPTFLAKRGEIDRELAIRQRERIELTAQLDTYRTITEDQEAQLREYRKDIGRGAASASFDEKVEILRLLRIECIFNDRTKELAITGLLGEGQMICEPPPESGKSLPAPAQTNSGAGASQDVDGKKSFKFLPKNTVVPAAAEAVAESAAAEPTAPQGE